jgi:hypothetical protein
MSRRFKNFLKVIVLTLIIFVALLTNGFLSSYNYFTAKHEIRLNHFNKICINDSELRFMIEKDVGLKYGFTVERVFNEYNIKPINILGIRTYNRLMKQAFIRKNGEIMYKRYINELDSINSQIIER